MGGEQRAKAETWKRGSRESLAGYVKKKVDEDIVLSCCPLQLSSSRVLDQNFSTSHCLHCTSAKPQKLNLLTAHIIPHTSTLQVASRLPKHTQKENQEQW